MLIVLGEDLDPGDVTRALQLFPNQSWRRGEVPSTVTADGREVSFGKAAELGVWKKFMPDELEGAILEEQLSYWAELLESRATTVRDLKGRGFTVTLDCLLTFSKHDVSELKAPLLAALGASGVDVDLHFFPESGA